MPIYEYQCGHCGHRLEALQKISDPVLTDCPECKQAQLQKLISSAGFQLKGTGWYVTDFKNKPKSETKTETKKETPTTTETTKKETPKEENKS